MRYAVAALLLLAACKPAERADDPAAAQAAADSARAQISARATALATHIGPGHADSAASFFADNAVFMPPNMPTVEGRANIRDAFQGMSQGMGTGEMHFTTQNVSSSGDIAIERGRWHWTGSPQAPADSGKYLTHWHRMNGTWMIVEDIFNSDTPAVPQPASRSRN